jgi:hypothetical protein
MRRHALLVGVTALACLTTNMITVGANAACGDRWTISHDSSFSTFWEDVAIGDRTHAWAVGHSWSSRMMIAEWDGTAWGPATPEFLPSGISQLYAAWADSGDNAWAVGSYYRSDPDASRGLILHWNGASWAQETAPAGRTERLDAVWGDGAGDLWAAGIEDVAGRYVGFVIHRVDGVWERVRFPRHDGHQVRLSGISGSGPNDIWAVGGDFNLSSRIDRPVAFHWDGSSWDRVQTPPVPESSNTAFTAVSAVDATLAWAVGYTSDFERMLVERWDGVAWHQEPIADHLGPEGLQDVVATSASSAYAVGDRNGHPLIERWDGLGWDNVRPPWRRGIFNGVDHVPGAAAFAVGTHYNHDAIATTCV